MRSAWSCLHTAFLFFAVRLSVPVGFGWRLSLGPSPPLRLRLHHPPPDRMRPTPSPSFGCGMCIRRLRLLSEHSRMAHGVVSRGPFGTIALFATSASASTGLAGVPSEARCFVHTNRSKVSTRTGNRNQRSIFTIIHSNSNTKYSTNHSPILEIARTPRPTPNCPRCHRRNHEQRARQAAAVQRDPGEPAPGHSQARPGRLLRLHPHGVGDRQGVRGQGGQEGEVVRHPLSGKRCSHYSVALLHQEIFGVA